MSEKIYINLVPNDNREQGNTNLPVFVAPKNPKYPDKNWTVGTKIGNVWYNQAAFQTKDPETGNETGGITVILTPNEGASKPAGNTRGNYQQKSFGNNNFAKRSNFGNKSNYRY
tara:strand:+ start:135 stop:476 length:342 start_codon:yes stop_codon:yes gene_type:complete